MPKQKIITKVMVFGTFDVLHKGHLSFFKQAGKLAKKSFLIVSLARDKNVKRIKKQPPLLGEKKRLADVRACPLVDLAVLGSLDDYIAHIKKYLPDIIALGYDQKAYTENLKQDLAKQNLFPKIVRLKPYKPYLYKSSKLKNRVVKK